MFETMSPSDTAPLARLVGDVSTALLAAMGPGYDAAVTDALARVGAFVQADRSYLMVFDWVAQTSSNTHEWCDVGIEPQAANLQGVPNAAVPWFMDRLRLWVVEVLDVERLPSEAAAERALLAQQGIRSILIVPVHGASGLSGFVGFDSVRARRTWSSEDAQLLRLLATSLGGVLERQRGWERLQASRQQLHAVLEAIPDLVFSVSRAGRVSYSKSSMAARDLLLPPEQGENRLLAELMPGPLSERLTRAVQRAVDEGTVQTERYALPLGDGPQDFEARFARQDADTAMVIVRNVTSEVAATRELADHRERLRVLAERQSVDEEALRRRVAAEVHDGLAQELAMARLLLSRAQGAHDAEALRVAGELLAGAVAHLDELVVDISPPALRQLGLEAALREAGDRLRAHHEVEFSFSTSGGRARLAAEHEALLYWSARELMVNVVKHAKASRMRVDLEVGDAVRITVEDDGRGFEPDGQRRGFGLFSARERLRLAGGELRVDRLERGSRGVVSLPAVRRSAPEVTS